MFGRKKMYKKGLADAMQAYEAFGRKQEEALARIREEVRQGNAKLEDALSKLGDDINGIYDHLTSQEKAALYHLSTPMDIKDMDEQEKQLLLSVLYQLADDQGAASVTEDQRAFIRSVQRYLEVTNPDTHADLDVVADIDSLEVQKAFYQVTLEFFYLQNSEELTDAQDEFQNNFSLNQKQAGLIDQRVMQLYNAMGPQGLAEKYGYVPEDEPEEEKPAQKGIFLEDSEMEKLGIQLYQHMGGDPYVSMVSVETKDYIVIAGLYSGYRCDGRHLMRISKKDKEISAVPGWGETEEFEKTGIERISSLDGISNTVVVKGGTVLLSVDVQSGLSEVIYEGDMDMNSFICAGDHYVVYRTKLPRASKYSSIDPGDGPVLIHDAITRKAFVLPPVYGDDRNTCSLDNVVEGVISNQTLYFTSWSSDYKRKLLWSMDLDGDFTPKRCSSFERISLDGALEHNGAIILYGIDQVVKINLATGEWETLVKRTTPYNLRNFGVVGNWLVYMYCCARDTNSHNIHKVNLETGETTLLAQNVSLEHCLSYFGTDIYYHAGHTSFGDIAECYKININTPMLIQRLGF